MNFVFAKRPARILLIAAAAVIGSAAAAQSVGNHAAHHPDGTAASASAEGPVAESGVPTQSSMSRSSPMSEMMEQITGGESQLSQQFSSYSAFLALPELDEAARKDAAAQANARLHRGLSIASEITSKAHGPEQPDGIEMANQLREAATLIESGSAMIAVLAGQKNSDSAANDWFRKETGLTPRDASTSNTGRLWGLAPGHWLFMAATLLALGALLALQMLRLRRVKALVAPVPHAGQIADLTSPAPVAPGQDAASQRISSPADWPTRQPDLSGLAATGKTRPWSGELRVAQIFNETPTVKTFRLVLPGSDRLPFDFLPGQFLQIEVSMKDETKAKRSYTIASSPTQRAYVELTIKRETQGAVSRHLHDNVTTGDRVQIAGPFGRFTFTGSDAESIVLIAGGVGITPMMSVLRFLTDTAWPGEIFFVYAARSTDEFVFRGEIVQLERRHPNLSVFASMERSPGTVWHGAKGHLTRELLESAVPKIVGRRVHLCGPPPMMAAMREILIQIGVPEAQIFSEAFGPASLPIDEPGEQSAAQAGPPPAASARARLAATTVTFSVAGVSAPLHTNETILEAAETAGVEIPYSCRVGECGVCVTRLLAGEIAMEIETGLDPDDKAQGYVLACQARCTRGPLVVEA